MDSSECTIGQNGLVIGFFQRIVGACCSFRTLLIIHIGALPGPDNNEVRDERSHPIRDREVL